jgi:hypothetical protein
MFQAAYGMTELSAVFISKPDEPLEQTTSTIGCVLQHCEVSPFSKQHKDISLKTTD